MRKVVFAAVAATVLAGAGVAAAQTPPAADLIKAWDRDGDGAVNKDEWVAGGRPAERFDIVDADKDGKVTVAELEAALAAMRRQ